MSGLATRWEAAWHPGKKRYFFQDRASGTSSWSRPQGCNLQLPATKPDDVDFEQPAPPDNIPNGWACAFSWSHKTYFYFNVDKPSQRTWLRPQPIAGWAAEKPSGKGQVTQPATKVPGSQAAFFVTSAWDAESIRHRIQEATAGKDQHIHRDILTEVVDSNIHLLSGRVSLPVPQTVAVSWSDCMRALQEQQIEDYGGEPKISVSCCTVAEAVAFFAAQGPGRVVCCINEADGTKPGGGYCNGDKGLEEDLCRRTPALHSSLLQVQDELYPFGPATCHTEDSADHFASVLFTPHIYLARGSEEDGFPIWPSERRVQVSVISAAPPNVRFRQEIMTAEMLVRAIVSLYVAPVLKEPRCTTLILPTWGCHTTNNLQEIMMFLVKALQGMLPGIPIKFGRLYHEVHFAVPPPNLYPHTSSGPDQFDMFKSILKYERIPFTEL